MRSLIPISLCGLAAVVVCSVYERDADFYEPYMELYERDAGPDGYDDALFELYTELYRRESQAQNQGHPQGAGGSTNVGGTPAGGAANKAGGNPKGASGAAGTGQGWPGVATFNDNQKQLADKQQGSTQCGVKANYNVLPYGAAVGDLSPNLSKNPKAGCGSIPAIGSSALTQLRQQNCANGNPNSKQKPPNCASTTPCGQCYTIAWTAPIGGGSVPGATLPPNTATVVKVIDACPHNSPWNYCKPDPPALNGVSANQKCMSTDNALDLDWSVYKVLTGVDYAAAQRAGKKLPNLQITISPNPSCTAPPKSGQANTGGAQKGSQAGKSGHRRRWIEEFEEYY